MNQRNALFDILKGFAIILVVLGHCIQSAQPQNFDNNPLFRVIYSFHMPLFMFISGWVSYKTFDGTIYKLAKRFSSLMIPYWAWFLIYFLVVCILYLFKGGETPNLLLSLKSVWSNPDVGLWFLWVLFFNYLFLFFALNITPVKEELVLCLFLVGLNILFFWGKVDFLGIGLIRWHLLFYILGYSTHKYQATFKKVITYLSIISLCLFPILVFFWFRTNNPTFCNSLGISNSVKHLICFLYRLAVPITGIYAIHFCFDYFTQYEFCLKKYLLTLGNYTLEIYCTHFYLINIAYVFLSDFDLSVKIITGFVVALSGSLLLQHFVRKNNFLSAVLYGKTKHIPQDHLSKE